MRFGLALPQYDFSVVGEHPLTWSTVREVARGAEAIGFDSLWVSDHLFLDIAKYGGSAEPEAAFEPIVTLAALAVELKRVRLGTLVFCEALRPASVLAKALATLDRISGGRIDVGLGAGWYEPEYAAIGMDFPTPGERLARLREALHVLKALLGESGGPLVFDGRFHSTDGARNLPTAVQRPRPPVFIGGKGDRLLRLVAERADGWNTCWVWTPEEYAERRAVLDRECERIGRDPESVWCSLGLYALCGEDEADLERRFERLRESTPAGVLDRVTLEQWRRGRLVGTVEQVQEQVATWGDLGVETLILGVGAVPFHLGAPDDMELLAHAVGVAERAQITG
ncbi:MAG: LLM class flavin-dependent oxidoreductase [Acidimicrobiia bacterium]|nr:LLM class flavin-dependent oxidoreductase [Acidimicrobiia bacterium]